MNKLTVQVPIKRIMAPIDGSQNALAALQVAVGLAKDYGADLNIIHVLAVHSGPSSISGAGSTSLQAVYETEEKDANKMIGDAVDLARKHGVKASGQAISGGRSIVEAIVANAAAQKVDLIVIGTRGLNGFKRMLMGSVSSGVVTHAYCPVLVVR